MNAGAPMMAPAPAPHGGQQAAPGQAPAQGNAHAEKQAKPAAPKVEQGAGTAAKP